MTSMAVLDRVREPEPPPASAEPTTFESYAATWLAGRTFKPRTRFHYAALLDKHINVTFGPYDLAAISPDAVHRWHAEMGSSRPTLRAHAYGLLRSILGAAVEDQLIVTNPVHIRGAGSCRRTPKIEPASLDELEAIVLAMKPERYRLMVLLASWCAMGFAELAELRRGDVDLRGGSILIRRTVARADGKAFVSTSDSEAATRDVAIPSRLLPMVENHLLANVGDGMNGLLFPASDGESHLATSSLYKSFHRARAAAGRQDLRWYALRHTEAVLAAATDAALAELMARLGHSTPGTARRYQYATEGI